MGKIISKKDGFTLLELTIVIAIVAFLAAIAIPAVAAYRDKATFRRLASDLKTFGDAFKIYMISNDCYPPDSHDDAPYHLQNGYGMEDYLPIDAWLGTPPWGGFYNWEGPDNYPYAGISLYGTTADDSMMTELDKMMDDGDLTTGSFQKTSNGRYTYIVDDDPQPACN